MRASAQNNIAVAPRSRSLSFLAQLGLLSLDLFIKKIDFIENYLVVHF